MPGNRTWLPCHAGAYPPARPFQPGRIHAESVREPQEPDQLWDGLLGAPRAGALFPPIPARVGSCCAPNGDAAQNY